MAITQECTAVVKNTLPTKLKDRGSFTISCSIEGVDVGKVLCDLGDSINLMSLSMFKRLGIRVVR